MASRYTSRAQILAIHGQVHDEPSVSVGVLNAGHDQRATPRSGHLDNSFLCGEPEFALPFALGATPCPDTTGFRGVYIGQPKPGSIDPSTVAIAPVNLLHNVADRDPNGPFSHQ